MSLLLLILSFVLAAALVFLLLVSAALSDFSRSKLEKYCQARNALLLGEILEHDDDTVIAVRAWKWLVLAGWLGMAVLTSLPAADGGAPVEPAPGAGPSPWLPVLWLVGGALGGIVLELWLSRPAGKQFAEPVLYWCWPVLRLLRLAALPIISFSRRMEHTVHWLTGEPDTVRGTPIQEEILTVVGEGEREGSIDEDAAEMIEGLMELPEVTVSEVMTPRTDMFMLKNSATLGEAALLISECGHSRIPVYGENRDEILGILYAKDLLPHLGIAAERPRAVATLQLRKPVYVPETKLVGILLREFQRERVHIAIVMDEYGGVAGLVTIEDILEQIVGEITDEHDPTETPPVHFLNDHVLEVDARIHVDELNELVGLELPEDADFDTVGGFVFSTLGHIPQKGESFEHEGANFVVVDASDRTVKRLRIELASRKESAPSAEPAS